MRWYIVGGGADRRGGMGVPGRACGGMAGIACVPERGAAGGIGRVPDGTTGGIGRGPVGADAAGMARVPDGSGVVPGLGTAVVRLGVVSGDCGVMGCVTASFDPDCSGMEAGRIGAVRCALCGVVS